MHGCKGHRPRPKPQESSAVIKPTFLLANWPLRRPSDALAPPGKEARGGSVAEGGRFANGPPEIEEVGRLVAPLSADRHHRPTSPPPLVGVVRTGFGPTGVGQSIRVPLQILGVHPDHLPHGFPLVHRMATHGGLVATSPGLRVLPAEILVLLHGGMPLREDVDRPQALTQDPIAMVPAPSSVVHLLDALGQGARGSQSAQSEPPQQHAAPALDEPAQAHVRKVLQRESMAHVQVLMPTQDVCIQMAHHRLQGSREDHGVRVHQEVVVLVRELYQELAQGHEIGPLRAPPRLRRI
mmetsp:Transcript_104038/g.333488  ORF Transcript_104038/g.333488 Transcript_104038/m.333488 type:complete len:295 (-) Transcript_104038:952-1836(-)